MRGGRREGGREGGRGGRPEDVRGEGLWGHGGPGEAGREALSKTGHYITVCTSMRESV